MVAGQKEDDGKDCSGRKGPKRGSILYRKNGFDRFYSPVPIPAWESKRFT